LPEEVVVTRDGHAVIPDERSGDHGAKLSRNLIAVVNKLSMLHPWIDIFEDNDISFMGSGRCARVMR
jgi:hypothetical protein